VKVGDYIKELRKKHKLTQVELANKLNVAPTSISAWEGNKNRPLIDKIVLLSEIFEVPVANFFEEMFAEAEAVSELIDLPIVGKIACGNGQLAYEEIEGYEPTPRSWLNGGEYFYLRAKGDSMVNARINEGDLLLIRKQEEVEEGEIAAVMIGDDAVLKRVYRQGSSLILQSENPKYPPIICEAGGEHVARIIGKLKMVTIKF
jgi:repressor LexA